MICVNREIQTGPFEKNEHCKDKFWSFAFDERRGPFSFFSDDVPFGSDEFPLAKRCQSSPIAEDFSLHRTGDLG